MAVENLVRLSCDRCSCVMEEAANASPIEDKEAPVVFYMEGEEVGLSASVTFYDLCTKCRDRVKNLCEQITLTQKDKAEEKPKAKKAKANGNGAEAPEAAETPEPTETPEATPPN